MKRNLIKCIEKWELKEKEERRCVRGEKEADAEGERARDKI
jgi:hypothetical protein